MANSRYSISRFYGAKFGAADNLIPLGYASEAVNVDVSDGALQTIVGCIPYPKVPNGFTFNPALMWEAATLGCMNFITDGKIVQVEPSDTEAGLVTSASVAYTPTAAESALLSGVYRLFKTTISGERVIIGLRRNAVPVVIGYENDEFYVRTFGSGMFMTSDEIYRTLTDQSDPNGYIVGVEINRVMTDDEIKRCLYAGVYIMEHEDDELDFIAAYVSECYATEDDTTIINFTDPLPMTSLPTGSYVKVRGGLSDKPVSHMATFYGRLFAGGDPNYPNRLYWSCLPGDSRTIEDWSADDASPDTGGGYVQVGSDNELIDALVVYQSQLLIWKGTELWRLYGTTPSNYTLECVYKGSRSSRDSFDAEMQERIVDAHGVPYFLLDDGLYLYDGSTLARVDTDESFLAFVQQIGGRRVAWYTQDLNSGICDIVKSSFYNDDLFFIGAQDARNRVVSYNMQTQSFIAFDARLTCSATTQGVLVCGASPTGLDRSKSLYLLINKFSMCVDSNLADIPYDEHVQDSPPRWEDVYHFLPGPADEHLPINAVWESRDLIFGEVSFNKKLRRVGFDATGPVRVIVKTPEGGVYDRVFSDVDTGVRRFLWLTVDMPYENSFRIRFESVDGAPFRIHNGVDFYVETNQRS